MGTQRNSLWRCVISGWLVWVFLQVSALVFSVQTQADMMRKGPLTLRALSKLVLMQSLDLVPLFVNLQNSLLISWCSSLKSQPMGPYVISDCIFFCGGWEPLHNTSPCKSKIYQNGPSPFQCKPLSLLCSLGISASPFPLLYEAEHCWQGGMVESVLGIYQPHTAPLSTAHHTRDSGNCSTKLRGLLKVTKQIYGQVGNHLSVLILTI